MTITRARVAREVHEKLDKLAADYTTDGEGDRTEGDYTYPIDAALRDCGFASISAATTGPDERAVIIGTEYRALERVFNRRIVLANTIQGSSYAAGHVALDWQTTIDSLRRRIQEVRKDYVEALRAIGVSLGSVLSTSVAQVVMVGDDADYEDEVGGIPWFEEESL